MERSFYNWETCNRHDLVRLRMASSNYCRQNRKLSQLYLIDAEVPWYRAIRLRKSGVLKAEGPGPAYAARGSPNRLA